MLCSSAPLPAKLGAVAGHHGDAVIQKMGELPEPPDIPSRDDGEADAAGADALDRGLHRRRQLLAAVEKGTVHVRRDQPDPPAHPSFKKRMETSFFRAMPHAASTHLAIPAQTGQPAWPGKCAEAYS